MRIVFLMAACGMFVSGPDQFVAGNLTASNNTAGIRLDAAGNYADMNRSADGAVSAVVGNFFGAGTLRNVTIP